MTRDDRLRIAVFIDFDNIEIGVKNTLGASFDAGLVLEALKERGDVVSKTAYSDWQRAGGYSRSLTQHAIKMVQRNLTPGGDKNGADINLALDALEMAFTHPHINAFVIVGGDSDFISLVEKLKQYDKKIFVVGGRQFTSIIMQRNCHEFIAYENLVATTVATPVPGGRRQPGREVRFERAPIEQAIPLVTRALEVLSEREVSPQLGLLKSTLLQLDSTFSERNYGAGSFRDFVQKLEKVGVVKVHHGKGGLLVLPAEGTPVASDAAPAGDDGESAHAPTAAVPLGGIEPQAAPVEEAERTDGHSAQRTSDQGRGPQGPPPPVTGTNAEGLREFRRILASGQVRRWPMYLRNVKQLIRQVSTSFDERSYGFANLVDLLRAAARDGIVRVDRDRQGVIRVFQGSVPLGTSGADTQAGDGLAGERPEVIEAEAVREVDGQEAADTITVDETVVIIDADSGTVEEYPVPADVHGASAHSDAAAPGEAFDDEDNIGNRLSDPPQPVSKRPRRPSTRSTSTRAAKSSRTSSRAASGDAGPAKPRSRRTRR